MGEFEKLLESVSQTIKTYREDDLPTPDPEHVGKWVYQFSEETRLDFLREFNHVIDQSFITKEEMITFLDRLSLNKKLTGEDPEAYWRSANFLKIQQNGQSQKEMLRIFNSCLKKSFELKITSCGSDEGDFIYIDDVMFSGGRIGSDLASWIEYEAPAKANLQIITMALHTGGAHSINKRLKPVISDTGKDIKYKFWRLFEMENRMYYRNSSNLLWPVEVPENVHVAQFMEIPNKYPFEPRSRPHVNATPSEPFSSEAGRQLLEREFLIAGSKIIAKMNEVKSHIRPLGFSNFGIGFGSTLATYRNCPNNCPLALWWGDPDATSGALNWYPLLSRNGYNTAKSVFGKLVDFEL